MRHSPLLFSLCAFRSNERRRLVAIPPASCRPIRLLCTFIEGTTYEIVGVWNEAGFAAGEHVELDVTAPELPALRWFELSKRWRRWRNGGREHIGTAALIVEWFQ